MKTKIFRIQGKFMMGNSLKPFTKELKATNEEEIKERIYSEFGSKHHIKRNKIKIEDIAEISADEVQDPLVIGSVSMWDLLSAFHRVQLALGERGPHRVVFEDRPLDDPEVVKARGAAMGAPPIAPIRFLIVVMPFPERETASGTNPFPLSSILNSRMSSFQLISRTAFEASECLTKLCSASLTTRNRFLRCSEVMGACGQSSGKE